MKKTAMLLASATALVLSAPVFAADKETYKSTTKVEKDSQGNYDAKSKTTATNAAGTTTSTEKKVDVDVDSNGNIDKTVKTEESTDPKGLMNKTTVKTKDTETTNKNGTVDATHKKTVNGKTVEDESVKH
jgi:hypothetical protein